MAILLDVITFTPVKPALLYGFAGAAVIAIFAAAVALFTWWPNQKYQPIIHDTANREVDISQGNREVGVSQSAREVGVSQGDREADISRGAAREAGLTQAAVDRVEDSNVSGGYEVSNYEVSNEVSNPAPSQSQATPRVAANGETYVEVQPGDTLSEIAELLGTSVDQLAMRNGIENPHLIYSGQLLYFSAPEQDLAGDSGPTTRDAVTPSPLGANVLTTGGGAPTIAAGPSSENGELGIPPRGPGGPAAGPAAIGGDGAYVVVQPGDTLPLIAELLGTSVDQLAMRNGIENPHLIYSGQLLYLP